MTGEKFMMPRMPSRTSRLQVLYENMVFHPSSLNFKRLMRYCKRRLMFLDEVMR